MTRPAHFKFTAGSLHESESKWMMSWIVRAYSVVSSPYDETKEFFSIVVPDGAFTSRLKDLQIGDALYLEKICMAF